MISLLNLNSLPEERQVSLLWAVKRLAPLTENLPEIDRFETFECCAEKCDSPKASIIIPVFNVEKYLFHCMYTVLAQTCREIEVICVDDCSTDASWQILEFFAMLDARVQVIRHEKNLHAGVARNTGMAHARGEYLYFCDPDDWCEPALVEECVKSAERYHSDIVFLRVQHVDGVTGEKLLQWGLPSRLPEPFSRKECGEKFFGMTLRAPWNKFFRRSFIERERLSFQALMFSNDGYFSYMASVLASGMSYLKEGFFYTHRTNNPSGLQNSKNQSPLCALDTFRAVLQQLRERRLEDELGNILRSFFTKDLIPYEIFEKPPRGEAFFEFYHDLQCNFFPEFGLDTFDQFSTEEQKFLVQSIRKNENGCDFLLDMSRYYRLQQKGTLRELKQCQKDQQQFKAEIEKEKKSLDAERQKEKKRLEAEIEKEKKRLDAERQKEKKRLEAEIEKEKTRFEEERKKDQQRLKAEIEKEKLYKENLRRKDRKLRELQRSVSFRLGRAITWPLRMVRNTFRCLRENGFVYTLKRIPAKIIALQKKIR